MRGLFVTGTDTGVGKTVLAAAIVATLRSRGVAVAALKPVITGLEDEYDEDWPADHELLARVACSAPDDVALIRYGPPVSPHLAAELSGRPIRQGELLDRIRAAASPEETTIIEGVGGLLVPLAEGFDVRALARELALPIVIAARPGLGTINHTLLTVEAARYASLALAGVVLTPWPSHPTEIERSNLKTIELLGKVPVSTLPPVARADPDLLALAGSQLPLDEWLRDDATLMACGSPPGM